MSYSSDHHTNDIVRNVQSDSEEKVEPWRSTWQVPLEARLECEEHNAGRNDRAAKRRAARDLAKVGRTIAIALPWSVNRATRRHPAPVLNFEPNPDAAWRGRRMFLQRDKKRAGY